MLTVWTVLMICFPLSLCIPQTSYGELIVSRDNEQKESDAMKFIKKRKVNPPQVEVQNLKIDCKVASRFAHTIMTSTALNKANISQEVVFEVELPKTAFITNFSMEIEGKTYVGEVKEKEKAKKQFGAAVSSGQTAGLVKASGRRMEKFTVTVNIAANSSVTFTLTYEELLQRQLGRYELMIRVKPKQLVQHFEMVADVYEPQGIAFLDTYGTFITNELLPLVEKTVNDKKAHVSFSPTLDQQRKCSDCNGTQIDGNFFINYDVKRAEDLGDIQIVNGYFVHFFAPANLPRLPKNVVFVIDTSGSMSGQKMQQTREALMTILSDLPVEDYFALVAFSSDVVTWRPSLQKATEENVKEAKAFVQTLSASGSTNMNDAVLRAVGLLNVAKEQNTENSAFMIILLTDGNPNMGEQNPVKIYENIRNANGGNITIFCLGFGYDVQFGLLNVLAKENNGLARRIYEASDAVVQLQGFYDEISSVLLSDVNFHYPDNAVNSVTGSKFKQLFNGSEIVVAGRLNDIEMNDFPIEVSAQSVDKEFVLKGQASAQDWNVIFPEQEYIFGDFTERLWAYLTIQNLLDKKDKGSPEEKQNATAKALELSLKYNFVTPLTSMVVTKPNNEENPGDKLLADKLTEDERWADPRVLIPRPATSHRTYTSSSVNWVDSDPHFIIEFPDQNDAFCFNIDDTPGTIFNLITDPLTGIMVNGQTIGDKKIDPEKTINTYFGRFGIIHAKFGIRLVVTTQDILVSEKGKQAKLFWSENTAIKGSNMDLHVTKDRNLTVTLRNSMKFVIILHKVWKKHPYHQDYLGFYTLDSHLFSERVHGLLGQFFHGVTFEVSDVFQGEDPDKPDAYMFVKGHNLTVTRGWQKDFRKDVKKGENVPCWFIHNNGTGIIDGVIGDYIVSGLFKTT